MAFEFASIKQKYKKSVYQEKINRIKELSGRLTDRLNNLEKLRGEIPDFWDEAKTEDYMSELNKAISTVRKSQVSCNNLIAEYQHVVDEQDRIGDVIDTAVNDASQASDKMLNIVSSVVGAAGTVAGIK